MNIMYICGAYVYVHACLYLHCYMQVSIETLFTLMYINWYIVTCMSGCRRGLDW
jgi:hypothetical protein